MSASENHTISQRLVTRARSWAWKKFIGVPRWLRIAL
jgi:hypothetical protein